MATYYITRNLRGTDQTRLAECVERDGHERDEWWNTRPRPVGWMVQSSEIFIGPSRALLVVEADQGVGSNNQGRT